MFVAFFLIGLSSCNTTSDETPTSTEIEEETIAPDPFTLIVEGTSVEICTVYGAKNAVLGSGAASGLQYTVGHEDSAIVSCGDSSALFDIGTEKVTLTPQTTEIAKALAGTSMRGGTDLIAEAMAKLDANEDAGATVRRSLVDFLTSLEAYEEASEEEEEAETLSAVRLASVHRAKRMMQTLLTMGQPVLVERIGEGQVIEACTPNKIDDLIHDAVGTDASVIGLTGCLVWHRLYTYTDYNNPLFTPDNIPSSFRILATESGLVSALVDADRLNRLYTLSSLHNYLFSRLGHSGYCEDDEGVVTDQSLTVTDLQAFLSTFINQLRGREDDDDDDDEDDDMELADFQSYRFHTGYNPSGGWEVNMAAELQTLPASCYDSLPTTSCLVSPLRFDFDGTTLARNPSGRYGLMMEWRSGGFVSFAWVIDIVSGKPYRDSNFQRVKVTINPSDYAAIDYANPLYVSALNPMCDTTRSSCAPYSNASWRGLYPTMSFVNNVYLFATPERFVREAYLIRDISDLDRMEPVEAYALTRMIAGSMAAFPQAGSSGCHVILKDHGKTLTEWDTASNAWIESGTAELDWEGDGVVTLRETGSVEVDNANCRVKNELAEREPCTLDTSALRIDQASRTSVSGGTAFSVSGTVSASSASYAAVTFSPTRLFISNSQSRGYFEGDEQIDEFQIKGRSLGDRIATGETVIGTYEFEADTN
ncbi:MAG: hypothetical protein HYT76_09645 [Deltaproteobacteria bacterium]|nr:hypothetical protein [Deltaproteobacteria bacterium]